MKDLIWTLIIIWLVYKVVSLFRLSEKGADAANSTDTKKFSFNKQKSRPAPEALNKSLDKEGEYVDYEEIR